MRKRSLLALTAVCLGAGCGGTETDVTGDPQSEAQGSCIFAVQYDGHRYVGHAAPVNPVEGKQLGTATQPGCRDTPDGPEPDEAEVEVAEIEGVSPDLAITIQGRDDSVLIRDDVDFKRLPPELARLLSPPSCNSGESPVEISGIWRGILGADGNTEVDLDPPYDVEIQVIDTSFADYERADLTVRVPTTLGHPLSRDDIESSLWEGGTITATVSCRNGDFVASAIKAEPPK